MEPLAFVAMAAILAVGGFFGIRAIVRRRRAKAHVESQRATLAWVVGVENAKNDEEVVANGHMYTQDDEYGARSGRNSLDDLDRQKAAEHKFETSRTRIASRKLNKELGSNPEPYDIAYACLQVYEGGLDSQLALDIDDSELGVLFVDTMKVTLAMVRQGDRVAMNGYVKVMNRVLIGNHPCTKYDVPTPSYPLDWDDMVIDMIASPSVSDFKNTPELPVGEVRLLAAEALRLGDRKMAKLVLAYCLKERVEEGSSVYGGYRTSVSGGKSRQVIWPFRDAIGNLLGDLIKMVEQLESISKGSTQYTGDLR